MVNPLSSWPQDLGGAPSEPTADDFRGACRTFLTTIGLGWTNFTFAHLPDVTPLFVMLSMAGRMGRWQWLVAVVMVAL